MYQNSYIKSKTKKYVQTSKFRRFNNYVFKKYKALFIYCFKPHFELNLKHKTRY